ncbi:hypothetical protein [Petroclostridium sp. X23]|uniref:hypothetical protein n=1 Tax=Petroclostridium sp. X23 TaxID=3045146 RepID=UPI0024AD4E11|nr:hypothetical protein [Petroclostridium sp. X23]WHH58269.1 hypothetical protein QKW49_21095 [Petroclostridium sp. X23]
MRETYDKKNPKMLNSAVCFIDILGFSSMIEESCKNCNGNQLLNKLYHSIKDNIEFIKSSTQHSGAMNIFSDNIVIGKPVYDDGESELGQIFLGFAAYQLSLTLEGFFVRGGVSIGDYYANEYLAYGPALLEAHNIECCSAKTPRIVLSQDAKNLVKYHLTYYSNPKHAPQVRDVFIDTDGEWFINYLEAAIVSRDEEGYSCAYDVMIRHRDIVMSKINLFNNDTKVLKKYEWVAQYHNYFCKLNFAKSIELQIKGVSNCGGFKFIA